MGNTATSPAGNTENPGPDELTELWALAVADAWLAIHASAKALDAYAKWEHCWKQWDASRASAIIADTALSAADCELNNATRAVREAEGAVVLADMGAFIAQKGENTLAAERLRASRADRQRADDRLAAAKLGLAAAQNAKVSSARTCEQLEPSTTKTRAQLAEVLCDALLGKDSGLGSVGAIPSVARRRSCERLVASFVRALDAAFTDRTLATLALGSLCARGHMTEAAWATTAFGVSHSSCTNCAVAYRV